jgi:hypothetical protein
MSVRSHIVVHPECVSYPMIMKHITTGALVLFYSNNMGWIVGNHHDIGRPWQMQKPDNYVPFHGAVTITNDVGK